MEIRSIQKNVLISPKKIREVAYAIKKLAPRDAVDQLVFVRKSSSEVLRKTIMTALANAKQKGVSEGDLFISEIQVNEGPRLKRFRAGSRGRAKPYKRRMSHIRVVLKTKEKAQNLVSASDSAKEKRGNKAGMKSLGALSKTELKKSKQVNKKQKKVSVGVAKKKEKK